MIIISSDINLIDFGITPCNPRIGWHNLLTAGTVQTDEGAVSAVNLANPATYLKWLADSNADQGVGMQLGAAAEVNYYGIAAHNLGSIGATVVFQRSDDGIIWTDVTNPFNLQDDFAMIEEFEDQFARHYRLHITGASAPPTIGVMYIGKILRVQRRIYVGHNPFAFARRTKVSSGKSESGQFLGRVVRSTTFETSMSVQNLNPAWVRTELEPFLNSMADTPFFWSWRPCDYPTEVGFAWSMDDADVVNQRPNGMMSMKISMQGIR